MFVALVVLLWISLIIGTYATGNVAANWLVCLLGAILLIRWRRRRHLSADTSLPTRTSPIHASPRPVQATGAVAPRSRPDHASNRRWR